MNEPGGKNGHRGRVIVIGAGLGGLSAAIHLRLAGFEVTIFEANEKIGGRANQILRDGYCFDTGPTLLNYPWVFEDLFRAANRDLKDYVTLLAVDPSITFRWPDGASFTLSSNLPALLEECERVEPGSQAAMIAFLRDAEIKYRLAFDKLVCRNEDSALRWLGALGIGELRRLSIHRSLDAELGRFFRSRYLREAFGAYAMYLGGSPYDLPGLFSILAYGELAYGLWFPKGGIYALIEAVGRLARELGVEIRTHARVSRVLIERGQVTGIELANGERQASALVVSNVDLPTAQMELIGDDATMAGRRARIARMRMTPGVLTFYWGMQGELEGLGHHTIYLPEDYRAAFDDLFRARRVPRELPFYIAAPSKTDADLAPAGGTAVFALAPMPLACDLGAIDWRETAESVKRQLIARMQRQGVGIDAGRIVVEEMLTVRDWQKRFGLYNGSAFGAAHTLFQTGPFRGRNYDAEVDGLYYVGASTTPGTGLPMVVLSGKMTAERVKSRV